MKSNEAPLVSVVLPVYNRPTVINTIESVLNQTYQNFELIVVDNNSTDNTRDLINNIDDKRVHLYQNQVNMGQTYSINRGLELSQGKYIARIDADDLMISTRLEKQVEFMENNPEYGLVGCWVQYITLDDKKAFVVKMPSTDTGLRFMQTISCGMFHPASMMRKEILDTNKITYSKNITMAEDYDMWRKIMKYSKALNLPEVLVYYRKGNNDSTIHQKQMHDESYEVRKMVCDEELKNVDEKNAMQQIIGIELQTKKSLSDCFKIWKFYQKYLNANIAKNTLDYGIIQTHIKLKLYSTCAHDNNAGYAKVLDYAYHGLKKVRYAIGR